MKKIILICLLSFTFLGIFAQTSPRRTVLFTGYAMASTDTAYAFTTSANYTWGLQLKWTGITGTANAVISIQVSYDGATWTDYFGGMTYTMSSTSGNFAFEDDRTAFNFMRVRIVRNAARTGNLSAYLTLYQK